MPPLLPNPSKARDCIKRILLKCPSAKISTFDQCLYGLTSKVTKTPMQKRTKLLSNIPAIYETFNNVLCQGQHEHVVMQGTEGGMKRTKWAQRYPPELCASFCQCFKKHLDALEAPY